MRHDEHGHRGHRGRHGERHHAMEGGRGGPRGERGRGERVFDHGTLRFLLLHLIGEQPRHGYELIKAIGDRMRGEYSPSPGVVYPTLTLLEEEGQLAGSETGGGRKLYTLTGTGQAALDANRTVVEVMLARMDRVASRAERPPQIVRAVENLRLALHLRMARADLTADGANAIAAALDAAAQTVERS